MITNIIVDNPAPNVSFTAPSAGQYVNAASPDPKTLAATATDVGSGVAGVEFFSCSNTSADCAAGSWTSLGAPTRARRTTARWHDPGRRQPRAQGRRDRQRRPHDRRDVLDVTVDRTAPNTTILTKPANPSNLPTPQFTFSSNETASTFECKLDTGSLGLCASPDTLATLADGPHTYSVRATDPPTTPTRLRDVDVARRPDRTDRRRSPTRAPTSAARSRSTAPRPTRAARTRPASPASTTSSRPTAHPWVSTPAAWDTVGPPAVDDGIYEVRIVVTDNAGNVFTSPAITGIRVTTPSRPRQSTIRARTSAVPRT